MTLSSLLRSEIARSAFVLPSMLCGVFLPLDFIAQVDGYLQYLHLWQLPAVYAFGWLTYGLFGFVFSVCIIVPVALLARSAGHSPGTWAKGVVSWMAFSAVTLSLILLSKKWIDATGLVSTQLLSDMKWAVMVAVFVVSARLLMRGSAVPGVVIRFAQYCALAGFVSIVAALPVWLSQVPVRSVHGLSSPAEGRKHPDIILITIDALAANHTSLYGYQRSTTPELEKFAQQASVFDRYYADSNFTTSAVNSFINGVRPWTHRALQLMAQVSARVADQGLVARLHRAGYETMAVATNPNAAPPHNLSDRWMDKGRYGRLHVSWVLMSPFYSWSVESFAACNLWLIQFAMSIVDEQLVHSGIWSAVDHYNPELALSSARELLAGRNADKPVFLWVHLLVPHDPYATPAPFVGRFDSGPQGRTRFDSSPPLGFMARKDPGFPSKYVGRYDEGVAYVDAHVGEFLKWLKKDGIYDDALVVVSADHGESFSHGCATHGGPLLTDDLIHVPLIVKEPGQIGPKRVAAVAEQVDLMPTILDLAGMPVKEPLEGRSLKPALRGQDMKAAVYSMNFDENRRFDALKTGSVAMIEDWWKYVSYRGNQHYPMMPKLEDSLYDLRADPGENHNLISVYPVVAARMRGSIEKQMLIHGKPVE